LSIYQPQKELLDSLCHSAVRAVGGSVGAIAFRQPKSTDFLLQSPIEYETLNRLTVPEDGIVGRAWQEKQPVLALETAEFNAGDAAVAAKIQAAAAYAIPISNKDDIYSVLLVYLPYGPLFPNGDISLLRLLTDRVALFLSYVTLIEKERKLVEELHQNSKALIEARDSLEIRVQERTAELAAVNHELQQFTYIISHDLRSPLVNLKGFVTELKLSLEEISRSLEKTLPHLDESDRQMLTEIIQGDMPESMEFISMAALRMNKLVTTLLDLSRQGYRQINFQWLNMEQLIEDTLKTLAHAIEEKNVQIKVGSLPEVFADEIAIEQIMTNLLTNAINYLKPESVGQVSIFGESDGEIVTYHIADNGRGIAPKNNEMVFAPFRRIGASEVAGEGMGLAYVQTLVRRHNGRIWFHSQPGIGSTFSFTLPLTQPEPEPEKAEI
jgi:signal transduction histidine kinase